MAGSIISLEEGSTMTASFRSKFPDETKAVYYSADVYNDLLAQDGCVGIRIYNAIDEAGKMTNVLVGVDADGNDLYDLNIFDRGLRTPPLKLANNPLNS
jgi:hypothetical protein